MYPQLLLRFRPNNQVSLSLQNNIAVNKKVWQSHECLGALTLEEIDASKSSAKIALANYRHRFPPLDISPKSQRSLKRLCRRARVTGRYRGRFDFLDCFRQLYLVAYIKISCSMILAIAKIICYFGEYRLFRPKHFGTASGQKLLEAGACIEILCAGRPEFAHCTTLTLPCNYREAFECMAAYSGYAVNRLFQYLRRNYPDTNHWFFVWEFQKRGALHLHICHYHPDSAEGMLIGAKMVELWHKILEDISDNSGVCMFTSADLVSCVIRSKHQHHTQPMYKGCGRYFAKYAMKSTKSKDGGYVAEYAKTMSPSRFWGSSYSIKEMVKENSLDVTYYDSNGSSQLLFEQIEEEILLMEVVSFKEDLWVIEPLVIGKDGFKRRLEVSRGIRHTFYLHPADYKNLMERYEGVTSG